MMKLLQRFLRAEDGATAIEYGLITALLIVTIIGAVQMLGTQVVNLLWNNIAAAL
jgi:pilus assembly protein Flp/PilA